MRWRNLFVGFSLMFTIATWLVTELTTGWSYMWYAPNAGKGGPLFTTVEIPWWDQALTSTAVGTIIAALFVLPTWIIAKWRNRPQK
jgi:hypothetical protein